MFKKDIYKSKEEKEFYEGYEAKYNKEDHFNLKEIVFFSIISISFFILLFFITFKFGVEGDKDIQNKLEVEKEAYEESLFYEVSFDEKYIKEGMIVYNGTVYYMVPETRLKDKTLLGEKMFDCNEENIYIDTNNLQKKYRVKDGYKYIGESGGAVYAHKQDKDIIIYFRDEKNINSEKFHNNVYVSESKYAKYYREDLNKLFDNQKFEKVEIEIDNDIFVLTNKELNDLINSRKEVEIDWKKYFEGAESYADLDVSFAKDAYTHFYNNQGIAYKIFFTYNTEKKCFWYEIENNNENLTQKLLQFNADMIKWEK